MLKKNIVVTKLAEQKRDIELCWQANSEHEALNLVKFLKDHHIESKAVPLVWFSEQGWAD